MVVSLLEFSDLWLLVKEILVLDETVGSPLKTKSRQWARGQSLGIWASAPSSSVDKPPPWCCLIGDINWSTLAVQKMIPALFGSRLCLCSAIGPVTLRIWASKNSDGILSYSNSQKTEIIGKNPFWRLRFKWIAAINWGQLIIINPLKIFFNNLSFYLSPLPSPFLTPHLPWLKYIIEIVFLVNKLFWIKIYNIVSYFYKQESWAFRIA